MLKLSSFEEDRVQFQRSPKCLLPTRSSSALAPEGLPLNTATSCMDGLVPLSPFAVTWYKPSNTGTKRQMQTTRLLDIENHALTRMRYGDSYRVHSTFCGCGYSTKISTSANIVFSSLAALAMSSEDVAVFFVDVGMFLALIFIFFGAAFYVIYKIGDLVMKVQTTRDRKDWSGTAQTLARPQQWFDQKVSDLRVHYPMWHSGLKWAVPVFMVSLGQFAMQVMLHCATYFYILTMDTYSHEVRSVSTPGNFTSHLSMGWGANASKPLGSLEDPRGWDGLLQSRVAQCSRHGRRCTDGYLRGALFLARRQEAVDEGLVVPRPFGVLQGCDRRDDCGA